MTATEPTPSLEQLRLRMLAEQVKLERLQAAATAARKALNAQRKVFNEARRSWLEANPLG